MKAKGFTLVEVIAASALLAGAVVIIAAITSRSIDALRLNSEYARAWEVLDRQLTIIDYIGIDTVVEKGLTSGKFSQGDTNYAWSITVTDELYDRLKRVDITVAWQRGTKPMSISAAAMFNGSGIVSEQTALPEEEETAEESFETGGGSR
jgi:prepilin-type N-terminal cleavage/methylation domain-containing protein